MNNVVHRIVQIVLVLLVLGAGAAVFAGLVRSRPEPTREARVEQGPLVEIQVATRMSRPVTVDGRGTVFPARQVALQAEVGGRVVWQSPDLVPGGGVKQGAPLLRIDARDYELALAQAESAVERARLELELEEGRKRIAAREWSLVGDEKTDPSSLVLREPQSRAAKIALAAAQSSLEQARLRVSRTVIRAPFNATVVSESVDLGQLVGPAAPIASLVGTDAAWVQVAIPVSNLARIEVPGALATLTQALEGRRIERTGRVLRLYGDLDPAGQMARMLVEVDDPLGLDAPGTRLPLLFGANVSVSLAAGTLDDVVELPRIALREGSHVFVAAPDDTLEMRRVEVRWRTSRTVLVGEGLATGDRIIVSRLTAPVPGMKLRVQSSAAPAEDELAARESDTSAAQ